MPRSIKALTVLFLAFALAAGCGGSGGDDPATTAPGASVTEPGTAGDALPEGTQAIRASSDIGLGAERLLIGLGGPGGERLGSPDLAVTVEVMAPSGGEPQRTEAVWTDIVPGAVGLYRAVFDFDEAGLWTATVYPAGGDALEPFTFEVLEETSAPALGEAAPVLATPTLADRSIDELSSDPEPDEAFYQLSLDDAIASGQPTVLVFSTPAFCQTAACGPLLEHVKEIAPDHPDANFIHVEVYEGITDPDFVPDAAHLSPAVGAEGFSLPSEPWVFVIVHDGTIAARFEGVMAPEELTEALAGL